MSASGQRVLLTGSTGLLGQAIVEAFDDTPVVSLTRHGRTGWGTGPNRGRSASGLLPERHGHVVGGGRVGGDVSYVRGDLTEDRFGLDARAYDDLAEQVDVVVHCAGISDFTTPRRIMEPVNVDGTRAVAEFASRAEAALYHISTAYIEANGSAVHDRWGAKVYIESKRMAEDLARGCDQLAAIMRPSIVWADSGTGYSPSFQGLHRLVAMILQNRVPLLPFGPETTVDFLPRDVMAKVIVDAVHTKRRGDLWITAGAAALTFRQILDVLCDYAQTRGIDLEEPRFVDQDMIDRLIKPAGGETVARRVDILLALSTHFASVGELPSSVRDSDIPPLDGSLREGVEYWARATDALVDEASKAA